MTKNKLLAFLFLILLFSFSSAASKPQEVQISLEEKDFLKKLAKQIGFYFVFRGNCWHCHDFAPIVEDIRKEYGFKIFAISLDGAGVPFFLKRRLATVEKGQIFAAKLGIQVVPAIVALDPLAKKVTILTQGKISKAEFLERLLLFRKSWIYAAAENSPSSKAKAAS